MKITRLTQPQQRRLARATAGIRDAFKDTVRPDTAQERAAFTLLELIVLTFVMAALIAVLLPPLLPRRYPGQRINCINNLKQIGLAFKTWSIDNQDRLPMQVSTNEGGTRELAKGNLAYAHFQVMSNELSTPRVLFCPNDTSRHYATKFDTNFTNLTLSYFVGLDASETNRSMLLSGDRCVTNGTPTVRGVMTLYTNRAAGWARKTHEFSGKPAGNICFSDGSVMIWSSSGLASLVRTNAMTQRLALP